MPRPKLVPHLVLQALQVAARLATFVDEVQLEKISRGGRMSRTALMTSTDGAMAANSTRCEARQASTGGVQLAASEPPQITVLPADEWPSQQQPMRVERL